VHNRFESTRMTGKRLIIHPGFHKSGTTALQESLYKERDLLAANGVLYPHMGRKSHHRAAWAISERTWGWEKRGGEKTSKKYWENLVRRINTAKENAVIISSEFFSELDGEKIRKIRSDLKGREIEILLTLRPLAKLLPSSYQQYLKYGLKVKYEEWLHEIFENREKTKVSPSFWRRHEHGKVIARWVDIFGSSKVTLLIADEAKPDFLFNEVNDFLKLPKGTLTSVQTGSNRSLNMEEISLLLEINKQFPKERSWDEYKVFIRDGYVRQLTDFVVPANDKSRLLTPDWAVERANNIGRETISELKNLGVSIIGNLDSLGSASVPIGQPVYPETIDIKTVASAMLAFDEKRVNKFPASWVLESLKKRIIKQIKLRSKRLG